MKIPIIKKCISRRSLFFAIVLISCVYRDSQKYAELYIPLPGFIFVSEDEVSHDIGIQNLVECGLKRVGWNDNLVVAEFKSDNPAQMDYYIVDIKTLKYRIFHSYLDLERDIKRKNSGNIIVLLSLEAARSRREKELGLLLNRGGSGDYVIVTSALFELITKLEKYIDKNKVLPESIEQIKGPLSEQMDPWGNAYQYIIIDKNKGEFSLSSKGPPNGKPIFLPCNIINYCRFQNEEDQKDDGEKEIRGRATQ